ncbi:MAG: prepilin-type N-terminal cleavage/methylation domain-containing protein [Lachnospiraceae bacterium]|nr:prepilin-type N-terminal cleavage/methylation domain-containing protein [Lachnospiraceae bacterium]
MQTTERSNDNCIHGNNSGFTLVELMVAVTILAIASIGIYQAFGMAGITNAKAQKKQNATSLAESTMEEIKSSGIGELQKKYNGGETVVVNIADTDAAFNSTADGAAQARAATAQAEIVLAAEAGTIPEDTEGFLTHTTSSGDQAYYVLSKTDAFATTGDEKFNVIATMRTAPYAHTTASGDEVDDANTIKLPVIEEIDPHTKTVLTEKELNKYDDAAEEYFKEKTGVYGTLKLAKKEIYIEKSGNNSPGSSGTIYVKCVVLYTANDDSTQYKKEVFNGTYTSKKDKAGADLPVDNSIYVYYKRHDPLLSSEEKITINDISIKDGNHKVFVIFRNTDSLRKADDSVGTRIEYWNGSTKLFEATRNSDVHYDDDEDDPTGLDPNATPDVPGRMFKKTGTAPDIEYFWLVTNLPATPGGNADLEEVGRISERKKKDRLYEVTVEVTKSGDSTVYATLTSTVEARP